MRVQLMDSPARTHSDVVRTLTCVQGRAAHVAASTRNVARTGRERFRGLPPPVTVFLWSRLLIWLGALYAWVWWVPPTPNQPGLGYATEIWARADSHWFVAIAEHGYQRNGSAVFYPLYPLAVGVLGRAFGGYYVSAGIAVSLGCCVGAFWLLYRLSLPPARARGGRPAGLLPPPFSVLPFPPARFNGYLFLACCLRSL